MLKNRALNFVKVEISRLTAQKQKLGKLKLCDLQIFAVELTVAKKG